MWAPRVVCAAWVAASEDATDSITRAGAALVPVGDEATCSRTGVGAASAAAGAGATLLAVRHLLATAGGGATQLITIPFISCGTGTSTVCSMMRSRFRSCGITTCCMGERAICSTVRCWVRSSVWVSASTRRALLALWCIAVATVHRTAKSSCFQASLQGWTQRGNTGMTMKMRRASSQTPGQRNGSLTCKKPNLHFFVAALFRETMLKVCVDFAVFRLFALLTWSDLFVRFSLLSFGKSHLKNGHKN